MIVRVFREGAEIDAFPFTVHDASDAAHDLGSALMEEVLRVVREGAGSLTVDLQIEAPPAVKAWPATHLVRRLAWISDSGHAWLSVPLEDVRASGIEVSEFSYVSNDGGTVFLEEDVDAPAFLDAYPFDIRSIMHLVAKFAYNEECYVRRLSSYRVVYG